MVLFHVIGFLSGIITSLMISEAVILYNESVHNPFIKADNDNVIVYSSPSCRHCANFHNYINDHKYDKKFNIRFVDLANNIADGFGSAIIANSVNPSKMRKYIFKTQNIWLSENDLRLSTDRLIRLCSNVENVNMEKVYTMVPTLMLDTRRNCKLLGHDLLPTVFFIKKFEGADSYKAFECISKYNNGELNVN